VPAITASVAAFDAKAFHDTGWREQDY